MIISIIANGLAADRAGLAAPAQRFPGRRVRDGSGNITTRFYSLTVQLEGNNVDKTCRITTATKNLSLLKRFVVILGICCVSFAHQSTI